DDLSFHGFSPAALLRSRLYENLHFLDMRETQRRSATRRQQRVGAVAEFARIRVTADGPNSLLRIRLRHYYCRPEQGFHAVGEMTAMRLRGEVQSLESAQAGGVHPSIDDRDLPGRVLDDEALQ